MRLHKPSLVFSLTLTLLLCALALYEGVEGFQYNSNETTNLWLRISHASSAILLIVLIIIGLPVLNNLLKRIRHSPLARYQTMNQKRLHRILGYIMLLLIIAHGAGQLIYLTTLEITFEEALFGHESDLVRSMRSTMYEFVTEDESIDMIAQWVANGRSEADFNSHIRPILKDDCTKCHSKSSTQTYAISSLPLATYQDALNLSHSGLESRQFRINMSGLILLSFFLTMLVFALPALRKRMHHHFQQIHRLGYWTLPLFVLHIPQWYWLLPTILLFLWDWWLERKNTYPVKAASLSWIDNTTLTLTLKIEDFSPVKPGDYVQIRIPAISTSEWHPFSIAHYQDGHLVLKISITGDWTTRLASYCNVCSFYVDLKGPYPSPASHSRHSKKRVLIAGGIGITPYWQWLESGLSEQTTLVWIVKDAKRLAWFKPILTRLINNKIYIYITDEKAQIPSWLYNQKQLKVNIGRPCWDSLSEQLTQKDPGDCFLCGPAPLMKEASYSFRLRSWHVFKESF